MPGSRRSDNPEPARVEDRPDDFFLSDDDDEFDDLTMEGLFLPVPSLRQVLGAIDEDERPRPAARRTSEMTHHLFYLGSHNRST